MGTDMSNKKFDKSHTKMVLLWKLIKFNSSFLPKENGSFSPKIDIIFSIIRAEEKRNGAEIRIEEVAKRRMKIFLIVARYCLSKVKK